MSEFFEIVLGFVLGAMCSLSMLLAPFAVAELSSYLRFPPDNWEGDDDWTP